MTDRTNSFAHRLIAQSPSAMTRAAALAHMHERRTQLLSAPSGARVADGEPRHQPEPDFSPQPLPPDPVTDPTAFGNAFWEKRSPRPPSPKPRKSGKPRLTVIPGDKAGDNPPRKRR